MVQIIRIEPDKSVTKERVCRSCGVTLSYVPNDIKEDYDCDYTGDKDYYKYIICPNCNKRVIVQN